MWLQWGKLSRDTPTRKTRSQRHRTQTDGVFKPPTASALEPPEFCWETSPSGLPTFADVMYLDTFQARLLATGLPVVPCPARLQIAFENMMKALTRPSKPAAPPTIRPGVHKGNTEPRTEWRSQPAEPETQRDAKPASWCREPRDKHGFVPGLMKTFRTHASNAVDI